MCRLFYQPSIGNALMSFGSKKYDSTSRPLSERPEWAWLSVWMETSLGPDCFLPCLPPRVKQHSSEYTFNWKAAGSISHPLCSDCTEYNEDRVASICGVIVTYYSVTTGPLCPETRWRNTTLWCLTAGGVNAGKKIKKTRRAACTCSGNMPFFIMWGVMTRGWKSRQKEAWKKVCTNTFLFISYLIVKGLHGHD